MTDTSANIPGELQERKHGRHRRVSTAFCRMGDNTRISDEPQRKPLGVAHHPFPAHVHVGHPLHRAPSVGG